MSENHLDKFIEICDTLSQLDNHKISKDIDVEKIKNFKFFTNYFNVYHICHNSSLSFDQIYNLRYIIDWSTLSSEYEKLDEKFIDEFYLHLLLTDRTHGIYYNKKLTLKILILLLKKEKQLYEDIKTITNNDWEKVVNYCKYITISDFKQLVKRVKDEDYRIIEWSALFNSHNLSKESVKSRCK